MPWRRRRKRSCKPKRYERTPDRKGYRNGYRSRWMTTRLGRIPIRVPQLRNGGLDTEELRLLPRFEQAFLIPAVYDLPAHCRKKMRTTNMTERTNEKIRRREGVIRIFPKDASAMMPVGTYHQELSEEWISGRRYLDMTEFHELKAEQEREEKGSGKQPVNMAQPEAVAVSM